MANKPTPTQQYSSPIGPQRPGTLPTQRPGKEQSRNPDQLNRPGSYGGGGGSSGGGGGHGGSVNRGGGTSTPSTSTPETAPSQYGQSRINPATGRGEYVLPSGVVVPQNPTTTRLISSGTNDMKIVEQSLRLGYDVKLGDTTVNNIKGYNSYVDKYNRQVDLAKQLDTSLKYSRGIPMSTNINIPLPQAPQTRWEKISSGIASSKFGRAVEKALYTDKVRAEVVTLPDGSRALVSAGKVSRLDNEIARAKAGYKDSIIRLANAGILPKSSYIYKKALGVESAADVAGAKAIKYSVLLAAGAGPTLIPEIGLSSALTGGIKYGSAIFTPKLYTEPINKVYDKITSNGFVKGAGLGYGLRRFPVAGLAYGSQFIQTLVRDPFATVQGTVQYAQQQPGEFAGLLVGGSKTVSNLAERGIRRLAGQEYFKTIKTNIPGVTLIESKKYGRIAFIEGINAQTEKLAYIKQLETTYQPNRFVFTSAAPEAIPLSNKLGKGSGFEVIAASKPLRGLYEAPPPQFLKQVSRQLQIQGGIASYYLNAGGRERLLPTPSDIVNLLTGKATISNTRSSVTLRRSQYPTQERIVAEIGKKLNSNQPLTKEALSFVDRYYNKLLKDPIEWKSPVSVNGKIKYIGPLKKFTGLEKVKLLNYTNFKGQGSGIKLKAALAILQYQKEVKSPLIGGAEVISGLLPYGPESQLVQPLGTKFFRRSATDLRKAKSLSKTEKFFNILTGQTRGQAFTKVEGNIIEFDFFRTYPRKVGKAVKSTAKESPVLTVTDILTKSRERAATRQQVKPARLNSLLVNRNRAETNRITERALRETRRQPPRELLRSLVGRGRERRTPERPPVIRARPREIRSPIPRILIRPQRERARPTRTNVRPPRPPFQLNKFLFREERKQRKVINKYIPRSKKQQYVSTASATQLIGNTRRVKPIKLTDLTGFESITL